MSRYEPPIPVKEKEKEDLLEKAREITSGDSKASKEKPIEGETDLSWDHEGLEPYPSPEKPKLQRSPKRRESSSEEDQKKESQSKDPQDKKGSIKKEEPTRKIKNKPTFPRLEKDTPKDDELIPKQRTKDTPSRWDFQREEVIDKDTEQWVNEQNQFWERQRQNRPKKFEPQNPVKILQRNGQVKSEVVRQVPKEKEGDKTSLDKGNGKPSCRNGYQTRSEFEDKYWGQRRGYGRRYGNGNKGQQRRTTGGSASQTQTYANPKGRVTYRGLPFRRIGGGQGDGNGNGED